MTKEIDLSKSDYVELPFLSKDDFHKEFNKGWSFVSVYDLGELRDVFLALRQWGSKEFDLKSFAIYCEKVQLPYVQTEWNSRRLLEHVNALKSFSLLDHRGNIQDITVFQNSIIGSPLGIDELKTFKRIYFDFFRFKEVFSWFMPQIMFSGVEVISNISEKVIRLESQPLYSFSSGGRFTNSFLTELKDEARVYVINDENGDMMRFWDVFVKWGVTLGILEKFSLKGLGIKTLKNKAISCSYIINDMVDYRDFNLVDFIRREYNENYIYAPDLVFKMAIELRQSIEQIHSLIIQQYRVHKELLSFERTSEIFIKKRDIKEGDKILFPKHQDSYVSHIILRI